MTRWIYLPYCISIARFLGGSWLSILELSKDTGTDTDTDTETENERVRLSITGDLALDAYSTDLGTRQSHQHLDQALKASRESELSARTLLHTISF